MFKNYIKIAWRNSLKNRAHSFISLMSLVLGLTFFFLITLWVNDELSYDKGFESPDQICRVETNLVLPDGTASSMSTVGWPVGKALSAEYPEIESLTYMRTWAPVVNFKGTKFYETAFYGDKNFFNVFGYDLAEGDPRNALKDPFSLVISESLKEKYFGKTGNALGKIVMVSDTISYKVTGVFKSQTTPSHLQFDMIGSFASLIASDPKNTQHEFESGWYDVNVFNYVKIRKTTTAAALTSKIKDLVMRAGKATVASTGMKSTLLLRPVSDIYLYSGMSTGTTPTGNIKIVRLFVLVGFFILIIACMNFINLTTAKSVERAKEIGIKKVLGSNRKSLVFQFLTESALMCMIAAMISMVVIAFLLPAFDDFTGKSVTITSFFSVRNLMLFSGIIVLLIPLAGFYPALVLSSYQPISVLKGSFSHTKSGNYLRKGLVITQFVISIVFILSTIVIWRQMQFMQHEDLGFDKNKIILVDLRKVSRNIRNDNFNVFTNNINVFKTTLAAQSGIKDVTAAGAVPGRIGWDSQIAFPEGKTKDQSSIVEYIAVDNDYIKTIGFQFVAGRDFMPDSKDDQKNNFVINESAVKQFGWGAPQNAIGKKLTTSGKDGKIIGVLKDYHQHGLQEQIKPVVLGVYGYVSLVAIRYDSSSPQQAISLVKATWNKVFTGYPLDFKFMDEDFQTQYKKEDDFKSLFGLAAILSIAIACMGILGLAIYTAQKRVKEIGIRKVLGASVTNITTMLSKDFLQLVIIALFVACPIAWYIMNKWLQQFAYKTYISWWIFPLAGIGAIGIALITIGFNSVEAALSNPVKSLRSE